MRSPGGVPIPLEITTGTNEELIIRLILSKYPITDRDIARELGLKLEVVRRTLKALASQGIISLEPLEDKTFIRVVRRDIRFVGRSVTQKKALKHRSGRGGRKKQRVLKRKREDPDDYSYM